MAAKKKAARSAALKLKKGEIRVGVTLHKDKPHHLVLLPGDVSLTHAKAAAWAKEQGGELPSRIDALVLFQKGRKHFERAAYWTAEALADDASFAWYQDFIWGDQVFVREVHELRVRAVRRVAI